MFVVYIDNFDIWLVFNTSIRYAQISMCIKQLLTIIYKKKWMNTRAKYKLILDMVKSKY